jgi:diguanylate cyclase (GGDEF)-like protein
MVSSAEHPGVDSGRWWTGHFDAALAALAVPRPLAEMLDRVLDAVTAAFSTPHGYVVVGDEGKPVLRVTIGRGIWSDGCPGDLDRAVRSSGRGQAASAGETDEPLEVIAAPVALDDGVVGSLGVAVPAGAPVAHQEVLARFAGLVAVAFSGARMITTERSAREQEKALIRSGRALSSTLELRDVLSRILTELRKVVPYDTASVQELRGDQVVIVGGMGIDMDVFDGVGFDVTGDGVPNADVVRRREPVIVPDIHGDHPYPHFPADAHAMSGVRGWLGVPLILGDECLGMITLDTYEVDFYDEDHADTALAFAAQAAIALRNARSFDLAQREVRERRRAEEELRQLNADLRARMEEIESLQADLRYQAERDALTGLYNRRYLVDVLPSEVRLARLAARSLALVMIDLDRFKAINDTYGHAAGDSVLVAIGNLLDERTRPGDVACRYGGEEFVVVLPGVDSSAAARRVEEWRAELAAADLAVPGLGPVTMSVGVASLRDADDAESLIRRADAAMYRAKNAGRDRVVVASQP